MNMNEKMTREEFAAFLADYRATRDQSLELAKKERAMKQKIVDYMSDDPSKAYMYDGVTYELKELPRYEYPEYVKAAEKELEDKMTYSRQMGDAVLSVDYSLKITAPKKGKTN